MQAFQAVSFCLISQKYGLQNRFFGSLSQKTGLQSFYVNAPNTEELLPHDHI
jgi:hypothetical protein